MEKYTIERAQRLRATMESKISNILDDYEMKTGLKPGIITHQRYTELQYGIGRLPRYKVNVSVSI
jgi:hypothetical protein